jgi:hypothetical protein
LFSKACSGAARPTFFCKGPCLALPGPLASQTSAPHAARPIRFLRPLVGATIRTRFSKACAWRC